MLVLSVIKKMNLFLWLIGMKWSAKWCMPCVLMDKGRCIHNIYNLVNTTSAAQFRPVMIIWLWRLWGTSERRAAAFRLWYYQLSPSKQRHLGGVGVQTELVFSRSVGREGEASLRPILTRQNDLEQNKIFLNTLILFVINFLIIKAVLANVYGLLLTLVSGSLISTCMPSPGVAGRKEFACLSHSCVLYFPDNQIKEQCETIWRRLKQDS